MASHAGGGYSVGSNLGVWGPYSSSLHIFFLFIFSFFVNTFYSLRRKRFRLVSEQKKTEERREEQDSRLWPREKGNERQKMKEGEGEGKEESFLPFFLTPSPLFCLRHFDSRSPFFAPKPHGNACYAGYIFFPLACFPLFSPLTLISFARFLR